MMWLLVTIIVLALVVVLLGGLYLLGLREIHQSERSIFNKKIRDKMTEKKC